MLMAQIDWQCGLMAVLHCTSSLAYTKTFFFYKYQEDAAELKDFSKYKPHILLSQENTQIRDLQQENRELWISLEEHQDALELIMSKYRKHMLQLMMKRKDVDSQSVLQVHQSQSVVRNYYVLSKKK
uniref:Suppressor of IKBKE 1 n=1 Tax=Micrurus carvalhoi TaxID=3147026 RepID=A0A2H6NIX5_9SAUR